MANLSRCGSMTDSCISTAVSGEQFIDYSESSNVIVTCVSRQLSSQDGQNRRPTASMQKSSYGGGYLHPNAAEFGSNFDWNDSQHSMMMFNPSSDFTSTNPSNMFDHMASSKAHGIQVLSPADTHKTSETLKIDGMDDTSKFSKIEKRAAGAHTELTSDVQSSRVKGKSSTAEERKVDNSQRRRSRRYSGAGAPLGGGQPHVRRGSNATDRKSCDHTHTRVKAEVHRASLPIDLSQSGLELNLNLSQEETATKSFRRRASSVIFQRGSQEVAAAAHRNSVNYSVLKLDSLHVVALQKIQNSSWYPKDRRTQLQGDSEGLTEVINTLSKLQ